MTDSFAHKALRVTLELIGANQTFPGTNDNTLVLEDLRMSASTTGAANFQNQLDLTIYGMRQADMNALTVLWPGATVSAAGANFAYNPFPAVLLETNDGSGWHALFDGQFLDAKPDYGSLPDVALVISAQSGYGAQVLSAQPSSYPGGTSVAVIARNMATAMGFTLENNGVTAQLNNPYFPGTLMDQFQQLCDHANIDWYFLPDGNLAITPKNQPRLGRPLVVLSAATGLIGYPTIKRFGISVQCLYNPAITLAGIVQVDTQGAIPGADGVWFPQMAQHQLESWTPGGAWFSNLDMSPTSAYATADNT